MTTATITSSTSIYTLGGTGVTAVVPVGVTRGYAHSGSAQSVAVDITGSNDILNVYGTLRGQGGVYIAQGLTGDSITNHSGGLIYGGGVGSGVALWAASALTLVNAGTITQADGYNLAVELAQGGRVTNLSGGVISAKTNAIYGHAGGAAPTYVLNYGMLTALGTLYGAVGLDAGGTVVNKASGIISAPSATYGVNVAGGGGTVINAGTINNGVTLSSGYANRLIVDPGAVFTGNISGGDGTLELATGAGSGTLIATGGSITNFANTTLDAGASWVIKGGASLGSGLGTITGFTTSDTIQITGQDSIVSQTSSAGVSHVTLGGAAPMTFNFAGTLSLQASYSGGITTLREGGVGPTLTTGGNVTFTGGGSAVTLNSSAVVSDSNNITGATVAISGFVAGDQLNFTNQNGITGSFNTSTGVLVLSGTTSAAAFQTALRSITFNEASANDDPTDAGNHTSRTINWTLVDASGSTSGTSGVVTQESSILNYGGTIVENGIVATAEVVNAGTMTLSSGAAVGHITVGNSLNTGEFLLSNNGTNSIIVLDTVFGTYTGGVTLLTIPTTIASTGKASNIAAGGKAVSGPTGTNWTLTNNGQVSESGAGGIGISLAQSGTITNAAGGTITAAGTGVILAGGGVVTNAAGGKIAGGDGISASAAATVVNAGSIAGVFSSGVQNFGISLADGGQVTNQAGGTITAPNGVVVSGAAGTVQNQGVINAQVGGLGYTAVVLNSGGTIVNGTSGGTVSAAYITGYTAVQFGAAGTVVNYGTIADGGQSVVQMPTGVVINGPSGATGARIAAGAADAISIGGAGTVQNYATIINTGTANPTLYYGVFLGGGSTIRNIGTASLIEGYIAVYAKGGATVTSAGTIETNDTDGTATAAAALEFGTGTNRLIVDPGAKFIGTVSGAGTATGASTLEFASAAAAGTISGLGTQFVNFPQITIDSGASWAISGSNSIASGATLTNSGTDTVVGTLANSGVITGASRGIVVGAGGLVSNQSGGVIGGNYAVVIGTTTGTLVNSGRISGGVSGLASGVSLTTGGTVINNVGGTITGQLGVYASGAGATVINAGSIGGNTAGNNGVALFDGGAVTNQASGSISSSIIIEGASGTVVNAGSVTAPGRAAVSFTNAGTVTNQSGGVLSGTNAVLFHAGSTNRLVFDPGAVFTGGVDGGNTIGATSISTLELASGAATGTLTGLGAQFTHFAQVTIDSGASWSISGTASAFSTMAVAGTVTNGITLGTGTLTVTNQSTGVINGGGSYGIYDSTGAATVANAGKITAASNIAVALLDGGQLTNASGGTITGSGANGQGFAAVLGQGAAVTVTNTGVINGTATNGTGVLLRSGGVVSNQSAGTIESSYIGVHFSSTGATLANAGIISGNSAAVHGSGVSISAGGTITNQSGGTITGSDGIYAIGSPVTVVNAGSIGGRIANGFEGISLQVGGRVTNQAGGRITGYSGVLASSGALTVSNAGFIDGAYGVSASDGGLVINAFGGTIVGSTGVYIAGAPGTVQNAGLINGTAGAGISFAYGGTVTNQSGGSISGSTDAVTFASGYTNRLVVAPGASFTGTVDGGNAVGGGSISTLELLSAATAGTISGLGTQFVNFAQVTIDSNAQWVLSGSNSIVSGQTLTDSGTATVVGTLTNAGLVTGATQGVVLGTGGLISNQSGGVISATATNGVAISGSGAGTVVNAGAIDGTDSVLLNAAGSVTNQSGGTISGSNVGIFANAAATIVNDGGITGAGYGIDLEQGGTVTNAGTIASSLGTAGIAVAFGGSNARLIDDPGAVFTGTISGGTASSAVFELASGSSAGIIAGFGSSVTDFTSLVFDSGAQWTVAGNDSANGLGTLAISGFAAGDTIDLNNFVAVSRTFATNTLVLSDAGGNHETLDVLGSLSTDNFKISADGNGGTDITFATPPTITAGGTVTFDGGGSAVTLDPSLTVTDPESTVLVSGTVSFGTGFLSGDTLNFTNTGVITGSFDSTTGTLTLSGTASVAEYQAALASISYSFSPADGDPTNQGADTSRTIDWVVNDGTAVSNAGTSVVAEVHTPPTIAASGSVTFDAGGTAVALDSGVALADADSAGLLVSATVAIGAGFTSGDVLNFTNTSSIIGNYDTATGILTLTGTDTVADYQAALASITYSSTDGDPTLGGTDNARTISWTINDGAASSNTATSTVDTTIPPPAIAGAVAGQTTTDEAAIDPFSGVSISDSDLAQTETIAITLSNTANGTLTNLDGGSYDGLTGVYTVTGSDAAVTGAVDGLVFTPTTHQVAPGATVTTTFTIEASVGVGATSSNSTTTVIATAVNDPPVIAGTVGGQTTTDEAAISPFTGVSISDVDFGQTETVTITLSNPANGLLADLGTGNYDSSTGVYSVSGTDAAVTAAVDGLKFTPTAHQTTPGGSVTTSFTIQATDTAGGTSSDSTTTVAATAVNDPPVITGAVADQATTDEAADDPFAGVSFTEADFGQTETVTITLSNTANGVLSNLDGGVYDNGVYVVAGSALAVTAAVDGLVFTPTAHQVAPGATVTTGFTIAATDTAGGTASNTATSVIATASEDPPIITGTVAGQLVNDNATDDPFSSVTITDPDFGATETVTITLTVNSAASDANGTLSGSGLTKTGSGTYTLTTESPASVTAELDALVFTPTPHEVTPGATVTTGMTLSVSDGIAGSPTTESTTSVITTAVATPPSITGAVANQGVPNQTPTAPFSHVSVADPNVGAIDTVTVTMSVPGNGTFSNLAGGSYNPATGVYVVSGTAAAVTAALDALVFTPIAQSNADVTTTQFTIAPVSGDPGVSGTPDTSSTVTSVQQVLSLASVPTNQVVISVSPDGNSFAPAQNGMTNEAVVSDPVEDGAYSVPTGYAALFAGGTADVTLSDNAVGNAILVANQGNDELIAGAANDILVAGSGSDSLVGGSFASTVMGGAGASTVFAGTGAMKVIEGSGPMFFGGNSNIGSTINGGAGPLTANLTGDHQAVSVGSGAATITAAGVGNDVMGGTGSLGVTVSGSADTVQAGTGSNSLVSGGSGNLIVGSTISGAGPLMVTETGTNDTIMGGANLTTVTASSATQVYGGSGGLSFIGGAGTATVFGGTGADSITAGAGGVIFNVAASNSATVNSGAGAVTVFGAGNTSVNLIGSSGLPDYVVAGGGNETLNASGSSSSNWLSVAMTVSSAATVVMTGGSGNDTLVAGSAAGSAIMTGGGGDNAFVFFKQAAGGAHDIITDFSADDSVYIEGYAPGTASALQAASTVTASGLMLTLSDGTTITFSNLANQSALDGKIRYG